MGHNSFGKAFAISSFGESHGAGVGVLIDGCPAGVPFDFSFLCDELARRRPGQSTITTQRNEADEPEILSGVFDGFTTGHPIAVLLRNTDAQSKDYDALKNVYRPSHADFTYEKKYGIRDHRGAGRASARITAGWVAGGAVATMLLKQRLPELVVHAYVSSVHEVHCPLPYNNLDLSRTDQNDVRCPHPETAVAMKNAIALAAAAKDSLGGIVTGVVKGTPVGLGEPVFGKLNAALAAAMFSINAVKGFELGAGFHIAHAKGSEVNDAWTLSGGKLRTKSNYSGGIQGGISNGEDIVFRVAFKPTATIGVAQDTVTSNGDEFLLKAAGRHDPCVLPRAVPVVEAMTRLVMADFYLLNLMQQAHV